MTTDTLRVVDAYHRAWTSGRFEEAIALLSPALEVEVPMNDYATGAAFGAALTDFGRRITSVDVLSTMASDDEAMMLYDMDVAGAGTIRVVEHFTVADGKIARIRHIHDTAALRAAGATPADDVDGESYTGEVDVRADAARVFDALTTLEGIAGWWTSRVSGEGDRAGAVLELGFVGLDEAITMRVASAVAHSAVIWDCERHTGHPEWVGTTIRFTITGNDDARSTLRVQHRGLVPSLECYDRCFVGWGHFLRSIKAYAETATGMPFERK